MQICLSVAILPMARELRWDPSVQGIVQSAFLAGYTGTQFLGGLLADKFGGKALIGAALVWFSIATALAPLALSNAGVRDARPGTPAAVSQLLEA